MYSTYTIYIYILFIYHVALIKNEQIESMSAVCTRVFHYLRRAALPCPSSLTRHKVLLRILRKKLVPSSPSYPKVDSQIVSDYPKPGHHSCCLTHIDKQEQQQEQREELWTFSAYFRAINWVFISGLARKMTGQALHIDSLSRGTPRQWQQCGTCNMAKFSRNKLLACQMNYLTLFFWRYKFQREWCYDRPPS